MRKTATAVKRRYNDKVYSHINVAIPKDLAAEFKETCERRNVSQAGVIREAIEEFIKKET